ncbi:tripartite tricarboxylate transporter substrate binding protein [Pigmentiphaga sp.]|uniref:Bug family tripartite tricarboxylate transporter substrate binding protein n=1 Tax=Pigmentiphaga sp. TaxID=1977564 RepID=UPI0025CE8A64|nr:tripartite tricarboxylate transporter substrate binding protein [Pigmentiphaga sp.]MBX6317944.1 tripartite tricarboxylate transporter substrate binding protein [Pigmentiphaga sp.]
MNAPLIPRLALLTLALSAVPASHAQAYPERPITFVVPFAAASATDQIARAIGQAVSEATGQPVVVENKPGANSFIGAQAVARAKNDGYTVLITTNTTHAANEHLFKKLPYDPVKDFEPVTLLGKGGQIMVVPPSLPVNNVKEFIALAKAQPGKLSFGFGSSSSRVAGELFKQMTETEIVPVPYRSNPMGVTDLMGGQIQVMWTDMTTGLPQAKNGNLKALGVTTSTRSPLAPDVPTIAESGVPGYESTYWFAAYVPAGTPPAIVTRLNELLTAAVKTPTAGKFYDPTGTERVTSTPDELRRFQAEESRKWAQIIAKAGIEKE